MRSGRGSDLRCEVLMSRSLLSLVSLAAICVLPSYSLQFSTLQPHTPSTFTPSDLASTLVFYIFLTDFPAQIVILLGDLTMRAPLDKVNIHDIASVSVNRGEVRQAR